MESHNASADRLRADLQRLTERFDVPGASAAIADGDSVTVASAGVINTRSGVEVTPDTVFMIQSITKLITATLILQLVDENLVGLDDPIIRHLPQFRTRDRGVSKLITVRHLLTHTGGFDGDLFGATTSGSDALERFVADLVPGARQHSRPGERFSYCNAGFGVLGRVVEVVRGASYEQVLRDRLAEPLKMDDVAFSADQALAFRTAIGHVGDGPGSPQRPLRHWAVMPPSNPAAGNQLAMSAPALLAFAQLHLRDGMTLDGKALLSPASARLMRETQVDHPVSMGNHSCHGLGWWLERGTLVEHGGGSAGTATMLRMSPRNKIAAVVLTNGEHGGAMIEELLEPWFAELPGVESRSVSDPPDRGASIPEFWRYVGTYEDNTGRTEVTCEADGRLQVRGTPRGDALEMARLAGTTAKSRALVLYPAGADQFIAVDSDGGSRAVEFVDRDSGGRAGFLFDGARLSPRAEEA